MSCSLRIKNGDIEIEYSGEESFAEKHLKSLIDSLAKAIEQPHSKSKIGSPKPSGVSTNDSSLTVSTIASKLSAKSGTDLATAAAYALHVRGKEKFTRN